MDLENPEWLPEDWKVVVEVRDYGKKYKYYINKSNGQRFNSKPEVLRYLESSEKKPEKLNKIDIKRTVEEKLPTGWIKETRTKKKGGKTRSDEFYIDPDTGHYFISLPQVFRYLETNDSGKPESRPDDKDRIKSETSAEAKRHMSIDKKEVRRSTRLKRIKSEPELTGDSKGDTVNNVKKKEGGDDSLAIKLCDKPQGVNRVETRCAKRMRQNNEVTEYKVNRGVDRDQILKSGSEVVGLNKVDMSEPNYMEQREKGNDSEAKDLPTKEKEPITSLNEDLSCIEEQKTVVEIKEHKKEIDASLNDLTMDPCIDFAFKILTDAIPMELAIKTVTNTIPIEDVKKVGENPMPSMASIEDVKKVGENPMPSMASPNNHTSASSSVLPSDDIWTDPCFENAIKEFTDEIAKENEGSNFELSFQQPSPRR